MVVVHPAFLIVTSELATSFKTILSLELLEMAGKIDRIYDALIGGAERGLEDDALYRHVLAECPKASSKRIVKASLLALTDPGVKDAQILKVVYALAIRHRLDPVTDNDFEPVEEPTADKALVKKRKPVKA